MNLLRTTGTNPDFVSLIRQLDAYLAEKDGEEHAFYATYNTLDDIRHVVLVCEGDAPVACGAIKPFDDRSAEVKRMFTLPAFRGRGLAVIALAELERWATELGFTRCVLETGKRQPEAIALYQKAGYVSIPNYGQYANMENSVCFEKELSLQSELKKQRR
jgi:GNAT superfamily N-acetyltransferase